MKAILLTLFLLFGVFTSLAQVTGFKFKNLKDSKEQFIYRKNDIAPPKINFELSEIIGKKVVETSFIKNETTDSLNIHYKTQKNVIDSLIFSFNKINDKISVIYKNDKKGLDTISNSLLNNETYLLIDEAKFKADDIVRYYEMKLDDTSKSFTISDLDRKRKDSKIELKNIEISEVEKKLEDDKISDDDYAELKTKREKLLKARDLIDETYKVENDNSIWFVSGKQTEAFYNLLYGDQKKIKTLQNSGISFGNKTGAIFSELVSGNFGVVRASFGTMVSSSSSNDDEEKSFEEAFQKVATYGGNTVLNLEYPIYYGFIDAINGNFLARVRARGTADLPAFGTTTDTWAGSGAIGMNLYFDISSSNSNISFFVEMNSNYIWGTKEFGTNLEIKNNNLDLTQITVGTQVLQNVKISIILFTISDERSIRKHDMIIGGQVLK